MKKTRTINLPSQEDIIKIEEHFRFFINERNQLINAAFRDKEKVEEVKSINNSIYNNHIKRICCASVFHNLLRDNLYAANLAKKELETNA